jgi:hypothetical protein
MLLTYIISTSTSVQKKYISIPFSIQAPDNNLIFNAQSFIEKYFYKNIILDFSIGENPQITNGIINKDLSCFELIEEKNISFDKNSLKFFSPRKSTSVKLRKEVIKISYQPDEYMALGSDFFSFNEKNNMSFLFKHVKNEDEINFDEIKNNNYIVKIGMILPSREMKCPQFFHDVKKVANLSKYIISFEFDENNNKGNLIFGDELFNYKNTKYFESQYIGSYSSQNHQIYFNEAKMILNSDNTNINISQGTNSIFDYNLGFIIGLDNYKKLIDLHFFDDLLNKKICSYDNVHFNNTNFIVYSCGGGNFESKIKSFPKLIFVSKNFEYNFELTYADLFTKINNKYYFLVIFKEKSEKNTWIFGQPFYKKYQFTINLDQNWVGFYNPNKEKIIPQKQESSTSGMSKTSKVLLIVGLVILFIGISVGMFFLGRKLKNDRKRRANELTDDNYIYSHDDYSQPINSNND